MQVKIYNYENNDITIIRNSSDSHIYWKNYFHKNPLYFRISADLEADIEKVTSSISNKKTKPST